MNELFKRICTVIFTLGDGSKIICRVTLNSEILAENGMLDVDGFVDLMSMREIPEELFEQEFEICEDTHKISNLDKMFQDGGKLQWKPLN